MSDTTRTMRVRGRQVSVLEQLARQCNRPLGNMLEVAIDAGLSELTQSRKGMANAPQFMAGSAKPRA
jgi:hypothetical protein